MNYEDMLNQAIGIRQRKRMSLEPDPSTLMSRIDSPPKVVEVQPRQYTPMPLNQALDLEEKLKKSAAKKSLKKLKPEDKGMDLKEGLTSMGKNLGAEVAGSMTSEMLGGGTVGDTAGSVLTAGISSGFHPAIMGAAAVMGIIGGSEKRKQAKRMARARGQMELAKGQAEKTRIYGEMAKSVSQAFGGGSRKRSVNF